MICLVRLYSLTWACTLLLFVCDVCFCSVVVVFVVPLRNYFLVEFQAAFPEETFPGFWFVPDMNGICGDFVQNAPRAAIFWYHWFFSVHPPTSHRTSVFNSSRAIDFGPSTIRLKKGRLWSLLEVEFQWDTKWTWPENRKCANISIGVFCFIF